MYAAKADVLLHESAARLWYCNQHAIGNWHVAVAHMALSYENQMASLRGIAVLQ